MGVVRDIRLIFRSHNYTKVDRKDVNCWSIEKDMPSLEGKVVIVTGTTSGIGLGLSKYLLEKGAKVYMLSRNEEKGKEIAKEMNKNKNEKAIFIQCDFSDLHSIRKASKEILEKEELVHILICNAGVHVFNHGKDVDPQIKQHPLYPLRLTKQGHELNFGISVLGHHFLIKLLQPLLINAAKHSSSSLGSVRIVSVSSMAHGQGSDSIRTNWDPSDQGALQVPGAELYNRSKLGIIHLSNSWSDELNKELEDEKKIIGCSPSPGIIATDFFKDQPKINQKFISFLPKETMKEGCSTILFAATQPILNKDLFTKFQHSYLIPIARFSKPNQSALDKKYYQLTWNWCEEQCKGF